MDANTLYYTLSTIAQAGAGIFAFVSAFVLYRLQSAEQRISNAATHLASQTRREDALARDRGLIAGRQYDALVESLRASIGPIESSPSLQASWTLIGNEIETSNRLRVGFRRVVVPTAILICASVVLLSLVDFFKSNTCVGYIILSCVVVLFSVVSAMQAHLLLRSLGD